MRSWFTREKEDEPTPSEQVDNAVESAYQEVCDAIDVINANMPLLAGHRYSLFVNRDYRPARLVLTDWNRTEPFVAHGLED